jgi:hypothetical protein
VVQRFLAKEEIEGSIPFARSAEVSFSKGIERERGRENSCFPVEEILKPSGFKRREIISTDV